jgi:PAS domain S-box-containing protein
MSGELEKTIAVLEQAQKKFRALLESAPDAMVIVDKQGRIKLVNSQAEKLFEYRRDDMLEHSIDLLVPSRAGERTSTLTPNTGSTVLSMNLQGRKQNGKEFPVEISLSPLETEEGTLISAAIRDISERKHIKELENKNRELEQFAYIASHDLQEPLNTISSFIMLLEDEFKGKLDKDAGQYVNYIGEASDRMRMLITGLLEYSRIGKKCQLAAVDCNQLLSEVLSDMKSSIHESEASVIAEPLPNITAYPVEIRLLLQNLLSNAVKYRKPNVAPIIRISATHDESNWLFTVEDNGIGIDPKYAGKLFVIFQRLHSSSEYPGTGIGLAHCKKIVELHNGRIWFDSEPGAGSRFRFTIPRMLQAL